MYELNFELDGLPKSQTNNYGHWRTRAREKREWEDRVVIATIGQWPKNPLRKARLAFVRCSSRQLDFDNLVASFKAVQDGLIKARIIVDDKPNIIGQPDYSWQKAPQRKGKIKVSVTEIE